MPIPNSIPNPGEWKPEWPSFSSATDDQLSPDAAAVISEAESIVTDGIDRLLTISRDYLNYTAGNVEELEHCADDLFETDADLYFSLIKDFEGIPLKDRDDSALLDMIEQQTDRDKDLFQLRLGLFGMFRASEIRRLAREKGDGSISLGKILWLDELREDASNFFERALQHADAILSLNKQTENQSPGQQSS